MKKLNPNPINQLKHSKRDIMSKTKYDHKYFKDNLEFFIVQSHSIVLV